MSNVSTQARILQVQFEVSRLLIEAAADAWSGGDPDWVSRSKDGRFQKSSTASAVGDAVAQGIKDELKQFSSSTIESLRKKVVTATKLKFDIDQKLVRAHMSEAIGDARWQNLDKDFIEAFSAPHLKEAKKTYDQIKKEMKKYTPSNQGGFDKLVEGIEQAGDMVKALAQTAAEDTLDVGLMGAFGAILTFAGPGLGVLAGIEAVMGDKEVAKTTARGAFAAMEGGLALIAKSGKQLGTDLAINKVAATLDRKAKEAIDQTQEQTAKWAKQFVVKSGV